MKLIHGPSIRAPGHAPGRGIDWGPCMAWEGGVPSGRGISLMLSDPGMGIECKNAKKDTRFSHGLLGLDPPTEELN